jgi:hypothetical protein
MLKPVVKAFLIQTFALLISMLINVILYAYDAFKIQYFFLLHATLSLLLTLVFNDEVWWCYINFFFPLMVGTFYYFQLPSWIYLAGLILSLGLYWTTYKTQVPFYPSRPIVWQKISDLLSHEKEVKFIDIGSGLGDLCMTVSFLNPRSLVTGVEIAPIPWMISIVRGFLKGSSAKFKLGNYNELDFSDYDIIFAYLSPVAMSSLWEKAQSEMCSMTLLISCEFEIPNVKPSRIIKAEGTTSSIYLYII